MTTRPGGLAQLDLRYRRGRRRAVLVKITRTDGVELRFTDHDRAIDHNGETFEPVVLSGMSADRREAAFRTGDQDASGVVGTSITIPDLLGNRYRGAEVRQIIVDWERPWVIYAAHRRWVRSLTWRGSAWVGTLQGRSQIMQRPAAGDLGGTWSTTCTKTLGGVGCEKDISIGSGFSGAGAAVQSIVRQRSEVTFTTDSWPGTFDDDYFRDGSFEWFWSAPEQSSTVTTTTTDNFVTDSTQSWDDNEHVGKWVRIVKDPEGWVRAAGGGLGSAYAKIISNTATALGYETNADMAGFTAGAKFDICAECANFGEVSPIISYQHANRRVAFLLPTPFPIALGDSGIWVAGCDGLLSTCGGKFADADHPANHGGDPFAPSAQQVIEPPGDA